MYTLYDFYRSKQWGKLLVTLKHDRANSLGQIVCEYCGKPIIRKYDCIGHHIIELTEDNCNDADISLNPDNIMLVHHKCHNIIHNKLAHSRRSVYLVYGSPLSGKTSYVKDVANEGDLIIDIDKIWECVGCQPLYTKPARLNAVVFGMRDYLLDCVKYRRGKWLNAYIIGGYPLISERERLTRELGAQEVYIDISREKCEERLMRCEDRDRKLWAQYIRDWWEKYSPTLQ